MIKNYNLRALFNILVETFKIDKNAIKFFQRRIQIECLVKR